MIWDWMSEGSNSPKLIIGLIVNATGIGMVFDWSADAFIGAQAGAFSSSVPVTGSLGVNGLNSYMLPILKPEISSPSLKIAFGLGWSVSNTNLTLTPGFGSGASFNVISTKLTEAISVSYAEEAPIEASTDLWNEPWIVRDIDKIVDHNGITIGYQGTIYTKSFLAAMGFQETPEINTGVQVFCGVSPERGPNNLWASQEYMNLARKAEDNTLYPENNLGKHLEDGFRNIPPR